MCDFESNILESPYNFSLDNSEGKTIPEYLLEKIAEFVSNGRTEWMTNFSTGETFNFSDIEPLTRNVASAFYKRGLRKGDVVIYSSHTPGRLQLLHIGIWRANGYFRPSYPDDTVDTLIGRILESKARFIVCDPPGVEDALEAKRRINWNIDVIVSLPKLVSEECVSFDSFLNDDGTECPKLDLNEDDIAVIMGTSGTTGASKGAVHSHQTMLKGLLLYSVLPFSGDPNEASLICGKPTHISGSWFSLSCLCTGIRTIMMQDITEDNVLQAACKYKAQGIVVYPRYLFNIVNNSESKEYDLSSIKYILMGGVSIGPKLIEAAKSLPSAPDIYIVYGMTENPLFTTSVNLEIKNGITYTTNHEGMLPLSVGKLVPGCSLKVIDLETQKVLGAGEKGELCFKSQANFLGYYNLPKETENTIRNGWIHTGDLGYYDENGFVYVICRCKEIFKYDGNHISPTELEYKLQKHPAVSDVCVVGIPDPEGNDTIPRAFVTVTDPAIPADEIKNFLEESVASYKRLRGGLFILPSLPVSKAGKVDRALMAKMKM